MGKINKHNYEIFFLDFVEGNLSKSELEDLNNFLSEKPDLKIELNSLENTILEPTKIEFKEKDNLLKETKNKFFDITNFEYLAIAKVENDISKNEHTELNNLINNKPNLKKELLIYKTLKLQANKATVYPFKNKLTRKTITFYIKASSSVAAAMLLLFLLINQFTIPNSMHTTTQIAAINQNKNIKAVKTVKREIIKPNTQIKKEKQKFSISHKQTIKLTNNKVFAFADNESQKEIDIYKNLNVSIPKLKTETLIFEKIKPEINASYNDIALAENKTNNKDKIWQYAETGVKIWKIVSSSDIEMNNKYKKDGSIEKLNLYASNFKFSKTFKKQ